MKKFLKYTLRTLLALVLLLFCCLALLYVPAVQELARRKALGPLSKSLGLEISAERFRLRFPLRLNVEQIRILDRSDTLVDCGRIALEVELWPLVRREAVVRSLEIDRLAARYRDTATGFDMRIAAGLFAVERLRADLRLEKAAVQRIALDSAAIFLHPGEPVAEEKTDSATAPLRWTIDLDTLSIRRTAFEMGGPGADSELSVLLAEGGVEQCRVRLDSQQVAVTRVWIDRGDYAYLVAPPAAGSAGTVETVGTVGAVGKETAAAPEESGVLEKPEKPEEPGAVQSKGTKAVKTETETAKETVAAAKTEAAEPWSIRIGSVALVGNRVAYGVAGHRPAEGFDPGRIVLSGVDLTVDSLYNRGGEVALQIRQLAFTERCGLTVERTQGRFEMGPEGISLSGFELATAASHLQADLTAGPGALQMEPTAPLTANLTAEVATRDLARIVPAAIPAPLDNRLLRLHLATAGTWEEFEKIGVEISSPEWLSLTLDGKARYPLDPKRLAASARFRGALRNPAFLLEVLPDTALRRRVALPRRIGLQGTATASHGVYSLASVLTAGPGRSGTGAGAGAGENGTGRTGTEGRIGLEGRFDAQRKAYEATIRCDSFPAGSFLPSDSLGRIDLTLSARGEGFDPLAPATRGRVQLEVARAEYRGHDFGGVSVKAGLAEGRLTGRIEDRDSALRLALGIEGLLTRERQQGRMTGRVGWFDLAALGLVAEPIGGMFHLDAEAAANAPGCYDARIALDSIAIRNGTEVDRIRPTSAAFHSDSTQTRAEMLSGDLRLEFRSPEALDSLKSALPRCIGVLTQQMQDQRLDMDSLRPVLPDFRLQLSAGRNNILNNFLRTKQVAFQRLEMLGVKGDSLPVALGMQVEGLTSGGIRLDSVEVSMRQKGPRLQYALRVANAPGNLDHLAAAGIYGDIVQNTARANLYQRDRSGREGLRSQIDAAWNDSLVRVSLGADPQFGFEPWAVNPDNYLVYRFDRRIEADLDLTRGQQRFAVHSLPPSGSVGGIRLETAGLGIGTMLELLPAAPPVDGLLGTDLTLGMGADTLGLQGTVSVAGLSYDRQRFGDVTLAARYAQGAGQQAEARLSLDSIEVLAASARYRKEDENPLTASLAIPGLPLQRLNLFLPEELLQLSGDLSAELHATGSPQRPILDGALHFAATQLRVPMIGTAFTLADDTVRFDRSRLLFDRYAILAPNRKPLTINGEIDLSDFARMSADLTLRAADFQLVNVPRKERTTVYGTAYLDLNTSVKGPVDELAVRGNVALLGGTDINYVMQGSPMEVKEQSQNLVSFVSFRELDAQEPLEELPPVKIGGLDIALNIDINNDVKAAVDLSTDGSNRIDLRGGGNLAYTMNPLGDMRLAGKYVLSGGTVRYNPPVIAQKVFRIKEGSYVEWIVDPADPSFNITAVESVRATVSSSSDGQDARTVNFDISINIRNTLTDLAISFGLAAPEDLTMQNQLNSLTAEQRANQAMNLLIYNTYTGPGTTAKVSSENPLNTFIQNELNQWAQNSLKGVDLSFGIDSYGQDDPNGQRTDYSYRLSKNLFSDRIRAVIGGKFSTDTDPTQNLKENLIDDISIEYMLDKRDNMYIRLFRHTGYESILEGEITETGVGFVIRERISRLGDLFRSSKPKPQKQVRHEDEAQ